MNDNEILELILEELKRAENKWPDYYSDIIHASGLICEESGETMQAALDMTYDNGSIDKVVFEAVQAGAMAWRLLRNIRKLKSVQNFIENDGEQLTIHD